MRRGAPRRSWSIRSASGRAIENEPGDPAYVLSRYVTVLALVPAVFSFIGACVVGVVVPAVGLVRAPLVQRLVRRDLGLCPELRHRAGARHPH